MLIVEGLGSSVGVQGFRVQPPALGTDTFCWEVTWQLTPRVSRCRGGLVLKAHRLLCHSTLGLRLHILKQPALRVGQNSAISRLAEVCSHLCQPENRKSKIVNVVYAFGLVGAEPLLIPCVRLGFPCRKRGQVFCTRVLGPLALLIDFTR